MNKKLLLLSIMFFSIGTICYSQEKLQNSTSPRKERLLKMDSIKRIMRISEPDLWKEYKLGLVESNMGAIFVCGGSISVISGLIANLTTNSRFQKKIGSGFMIVGGAMAAVGLPLFVIGLNKQSVAIRDCTNRAKNRQTELQFGIMPSGGIGLALKF
jgi:hypothetical protein